MVEVDIAKKFAHFKLQVGFRAAGKMIVVFGPSGAGKSLCLQAVAGLIKPDSGLIRVDGRTFFAADKGVNQPPQKRRVGYVLQEYALFPHLTVGENIAFGLRGLTRWARRSRVDEMLKLMRLERVAEMYPARISGGQKQRTALARALIIEPQVLLLDEPFSALDSAVREKLRLDLTQIKQQYDIPIILVTHNLEEAYQLAEEMVIIDEGRVLQTGDRDEIFYHPANRTVARFVGVKNIFRGRVINKTTERLVIDVGFFRATAVCRHPAAVGTEIGFCIRPEEIMVIRPDREVSGALKENAVRGRVTAVSHRGDSCLLQFKIDGYNNNDSDYDLTIKLPAHAYRKLELPKYDKVTVSLKEQAIHVFNSGAGSSVADSPRSPLKEVVTVD